MPCPLRPARQHTLLLGSRPTTQTTITGRHAIPVTRRPPDDRLRDATAPLGNFSLPLPLSACPLLLFTVQHLSVPLVSFLSLAVEAD
ncbi:hypothetical protein BaRGS_00006417 [Batillaria attramentaria]|uniref:Uncharacterized protein n=1 Tax=Batillaria attramentaria TaxID=370345 RepID=A0ABD0LTY3_9CAEN